jgi:hypothetical protein
MKCYSSLAQEHCALIAQYGQVQRRCSAVITRQAAEIERLQAQAIQLRGRLIVSETALALERNDRLALEAAIPGLPRRLTLARRVETLMQRVQDLMRERLGLQRRQERPEGLGDLREKSVLCIGEDGPDTQAAQIAVELAGGLFRRLGGDAGPGNRQYPATLEASLVAADLVICQTGCVSHDAYWRVQDHCRRTGKQCVLVNQPQAMLFVRGLQAGSEAAGTQG